MTEDMMATRAQLMMTPAKTLHDLIEQFGESSKAKERLGLVMEADQLFKAKMRGESWKTSLLTIRSELGGHWVKVEIDDSSSGKSDTVQNVKFHKDFNLSGQIDSKTGTSYTSLIRQIELGLQKGHSEADVIDGVIRAVIPTSSLRSYLDDRRDLDLGILRGILRGHYAEKNSTELYSELASAVQQPKETSTEFLMRTMDLRNKILFASQESSDELKYSPELLHKRFARIFQNGLRETIIRQEMKAFLLDDKISDADLLDELNKIVRRESENKQKVGKTFVSSVKSSENDELLAEVWALKVKVSQLNAMAMTRDDQIYGKGCRSCREKKLKNCRHCWYCGSEVHQRRNCPNRQTDSSSGNQRRPLPRD